MTPRDLRSSDDASLLAACRDGDTGAYALLWERHSRAGITAARSIAPGLDAEDLVSEAYLKILELLAAGRGPKGAFRPYLYRVIQSRAADALRMPEQSDDELESIPDTSQDNPWDTVAFDRGAVARAFSSLDERWQAVLWYTEVEGLAPREAAKFMGLSPNGVSALRLRARKALQSAWAEAHLSRRVTDAECRSTLEQLPRYERGKLAAARRRQVEAHLSSCSECARAAKEHALLISQLPLIIAAVLLGGGVAARLLSGSGAELAVAAPAQAGEAALGAQQPGTAGTAGAAAAASGSVTALPAVLISAGLAAVLAVGTLLATMLPPLSEQPPPGPPRETAAPVPPGQLGEGPGEVLGEQEEPLDPGDEQPPGQDGPPVRKDPGSDSGGDHGAPDDDGAEPPPEDASDPALSVFDLCYAEQEGPGSYNLVGYAPEYGAIRARITQGEGSEPVPIVPPGFESVDDQYGNTFTEILTGVDPGQDNWWWASSLTPLSQWDGLVDAPIDGVTIELRLLTPDGRYSPWVEVGALSDCV